MANSDSVNGKGNNHTALKVAAGTTAGVGAGLLLYKFGGPLGSMAKAAATAMKELTPTEVKNVMARFAKWSTEMGGVAAHAGSGLLDEVPGVAKDLAGQRSLTTAKATAQRYGGRLLATAKRSGTKGA